MGTVAFCQRPAFLVSRFVLDANGRASLPTQTFFIQARGGRSTWVPVLADRPSWSLKRVRKRPWFRGGPVGCLLRGALRTRRKPARRYCSQDLKAVGVEQCATIQRGFASRIIELHNLSGCAEVPGEIPDGSCSVGRRACRCSWLGHLGVGGQLDGGSSIRAEETSMADLPKEAVEYFCYISRSKVDQLFHALAPRDADEWTEHSTNERAFGANLSADLNLARIFSLFKGALLTAVRASFSENRSSRLSMSRNCVAYYWPSRRKVPFLRSHKQFEPEISSPSITITMASSGWKVGERSQCCVSGRDPNRDRGNRVIAGLWVALLYRGAAAGWYVRPQLVQRAFFCGRPRAFNEHGVLGSRSKP